MSCTFLYGRNHRKCVPCAYVLDNFAAARGMANLSEIYMSASPEGPFTSIANANSSVGLSTVTRLTTTVFYDTSFNTPSMWRMSIWPSDPPNAPCCPRPFGRALVPPCVDETVCSPCRVGSQPLLRLGRYRRQYCREYICLVRRGPCCMFMYVLHPHHWPYFNTLGLPV